MGFKLIPDNTKINFLKYRKICAVLSIGILLGTLLLLGFKGLNYGIDFSGGTLVQIQTEKVVNVARLRDALNKAGYEGLTIQEYGAEDEFIVRMAGGDGAEATQHAEEMAQAVQAVAGQVDVRRVEFVGPQIGEELRRKGIIALSLALIAILIYISARFEFRYGVGAIAALGHDIFMTVGVFALLQKEVTLTVLAALLTIIGYSLNDTIVVFDRVRENTRKYRKRKMMDILDLSINEMLNRTLITSLTTFVVLLALFMFGGGVIHDFAFTLMFGVLVGTYSSVFIASPVVLLLDKYYKNRPDKDKEKIQPGTV